MNVKKKMEEVVLFFFFFGTVLGGWHKGVLESVKTSLIQSTVKGVSQVSWMKCLENCFIKEPSSNCNQF